jgi:hypothetical protein
VRDSETNRNERRKGCSHRGERPFDNRPEGDAECEGEERIRNQDDWLDIERIPDANQGSLRR